MSVSHNIAIVTANINQVYTGEFSNGSSSEFTADADALTQKQRKAITKFNDCLCDLENRCGAITSITITAI